MSKKFKMPEKWCIKGCSKMDKFQMNELSNKANCTLASIHLFYYTTDNGFLNWLYQREFPEGYTEITFEQFNEYYYSMQKPVKKSPIEQLREKCKGLEYTPLFSGTELMKLEIDDSCGRIMHRLEGYKDFDKLCENALVILNLEK